MFLFLCKITIFSGNRAYFTNKFSNFALCKKNKSGMDFSNMKYSKKQYYMVFSACILLIFVLAYMYCFAPFSRCNDTRYVYIDKDDNVDSVLKKVDTIATRHSYFGFRTMVRHSKYAKHIRTGRYEIKPGETTFSVFRHIKNGRQTPLNITIPSVRTTDRLAGELGKKLMMDSLEVLRMLDDEAFCQKHGLDTATIISMFIPNTYEVYWDIPVEKFMDKMDKESKNFWNNDRQSKAKELGLTPVQVITLASIIDEETANNGEKPMVAGMYYNRYKINMPLQADPTIKFARKDFEARRIYRDWLSINSPYNTYRNAGLPPGPIRIPTVAGIDAVLNMVHHDYLYMCAKEDFSGTHNFAVTYAEHQKNAAKYSQALNARGIK